MARRTKEHTRLAFLKLGSNAVPELHRILSARSNSRNERLRNWAVRIGLLRPRQEPLTELQCRATTAAAVVAADTGADIRRLVPHLTYHFTNGNRFHGWADRTLAAAGIEGIAVLTNLLFTGTKPQRDSVGWALSQWEARKAPQTAEALLRAAATERDEGVRANLVLYLGSLRLPAEKIIPLAAQALESTNGYVRWTAATSLAKYKTNSAVRNLLAPMTNDPDARVREAAMRAFAH